MELTEPMSFAEESSTRNARPHILTACRVGVPCCCATILCCCWTGLVPLFAPRSTTVRAFGACWITWRGTGVTWWPAPCVSTSLRGIEGDWFATVPGWGARTILCPRTATWKCGSSALLWIQEKWTSGWWRCHKHHKQNPQNSTEETDRIPKRS
jgi:hypothetical protein